MESTDKPLSWYAERVECLAEFMTEERYDTLRSTLAQRTKHITICSENTFHPHNASALIRNCEAFGIQEIHAIETLCKFRPSVQVVKGTDKWIDIRRHATTAEAIAALRADGYRIVATTPHIDGTTPLDFDVEAGPFALVFGTEHAGITDPLIDSADAYIHIPMQGFVESLNVSASAAILLYNLAERLRTLPTEKWALSHEEQLPILYRWMRSSVRESRKILERRFPTP